MARIVAGKPAPGYADRILDTAGQVEKFHRRYGQRLLDGLKAADGDAS